MCILGFVLFWRFWYFVQFCWILCLLLGSTLPTLHPALCPRGCPVWISSAGLSQREAQWEITRWAQWGLWLYSPSPHCRAAAWQCLHLPLKTTTPMRTSLLRFREPLPLLVLSVLSKGRHGTAVSTEVLPRPCRLTHSPANGLFLNSLQSPLLLPARTLADIPAHVSFYRGASTSFSIIQLGKSKRCES